MPQPASIVEPKLTRDTVLDPSQAMAYAVELARQGPAYGLNPQVGAVLLRDGQVIGVGWHKGAGSPHAEAAAIADAQARGNDVRGATLVVTLEPCRHQGHTPPCTSLIQAAGIARVYYACTDPGEAAGGGARVLTEAGVPITQLPSEAATELIHAWATSVELGRPYVTVKLATSLDGRVAAADGSSQWITGAASRAHAHQVRAQMDAIAVTTGTVQADNPRLTARLPSGELAEHQPLRVIVGKSDISPDAHVFHDHGLLRHTDGAVMVSKPPDARPQVIHLRTHDVIIVLTELAKLGVRHLLIEGGPALITACFRAGIVDEIHSYIAPVVIGAGPTAVSDYGATTLGAAQRFTTKHVEKLGDDVLLIARRTKPNAADGSDGSGGSDGLDA